MEKTFAYGINQKVLCALISNEFYKDTENTRIYIVVNQIPLGKEDYIIECVDDKVQYPVFEGELIAYVSEDERKLQEMFDEKHKEKPLTPRQQWLRRLLDDTYDEDDEKALPLKAIYELYETDLLRGDNVVYPNWDYENEHNSSALRAIRDDFMTFATHWSTQAVYTSSNRGLKRANDKEALPILMREYMFAKMRFLRVNNKLDRIDKDGQMRIKLTEHQGDTYDPYKTYRKGDEPTK